MKDVLLPTLAALAFAGCAAISPEPSSREMKIAFDVTDGNPQVLLKKLDTIDVTRKQLIEKGITPKMVISFRGNASYYTQTNLSMVKEADRADALAIAAKLRELRKANGVESLEQCNLPLAERKLNPADVMQEIKVVPNGWIALVGYQEKGYRYIVP